MATLDSLASTHRVILKIGSAILVDAETGELRTSWLDSVAQDIADLKARDVDVVIVSSGAIALNSAL